MNINSRKLRLLDLRLEGMSLGLIIAVLFAIIGGIVYFATIGGGYHEMVMAVHPIIVGILSRL